MGGQDLLAASLVKHATVKRISAYRGRDVRIYNSKFLSFSLSTQDVPFFADDSSEGPEKTSRSLATFQLHASLDLRKKNMGSVDITITIEPHTTPQKRKVLTTSRANASTYRGA
jgi:hypothetical protein